MKRLQWASGVAGFAVQFALVPWLDMQGTRSLAGKAHQLANGFAAALFLLLLAQFLLSPWTRRTWRIHLLGLAVLSLLGPAMLGQRALLPAVLAGTIATYVLGSARRGVEFRSTQWLLLLGVVGGTLRLAAPVLARASADYTFLPSGSHAVQAAVGLHLALLAWLGAGMLAQRTQPWLRVATAGLWGAFFGLCVLAPELPGQSPAWGVWRDQLGIVPGVPSWALFGLALGSSVLCAFNRARGARDVGALLALGGGAVHPPAFALLTLAAAVPEALPPSSDDARGATRSMTM